MKDGTEEITFENYNNIYTIKNKNDFLFYENKLKNPQQQMQNALPNLNDFSKKINLSSKGSKFL